MAKKKIIGRHDKVMDLTYGKKYNPKTKINAAAFGDWFNTNTLGSVFGAAPAMVQGFTNNSNIKKREDLALEAKLGTLETFNGVNSLDALQSARDAYAPMPNLNRKNLMPTNKELWGNAASSALAGVGAGLSMGSAPAAIGLGLLGAGIAGVGYLRGRNKADQWIEDYNDLKAAREERLDAAERYQLGNIYENRRNRLLANYSATGGYLNRAGYGTSVGSASMPDIFTHGGIFSNGMQLIDAGGSHEDNPNDGVTVSYDANGVPNKVEEGEVIFNDYVFSNRFAPGGDLLEKYHLPKTWERYTFARIAEKLGEESRERPNDPISRNGLTVSMDGLSAMQEEYKEVERQKEIARIIKRMTPEEKAAMFDAASQQMQEQYETPEEMYSAQMPYPEEEVPAFMPQEYAAGGNIFDGTRQSRLQRSLNRNLRAAEIRSNRQQILDANTISEEQSAANEALARNIATALLRQVGVDNPSRTLLNRTIQALTGAQAVNEFSRSVTSTLPGSVAPVRVRTVHGEPTLEGLVALASSLGIDTSTTEGYNAVRSIFANASSGRTTQPTVAEASTVETKAATETPESSGDPVAKHSVPPSGGRSGNGTGNPKAGSATKASETPAETTPAAETLPPAPDIAWGDVLNGRPISDLRIFRDPLQNTSLEAAARAEQQRVLNTGRYADESARTQQLNAFREQALQRGRLSSNPIPEDGGRGRNTALRYAGAAFAGLGALTSLLTPPDYTYANEIRGAGIPYEEVTFQPVENYLTYRPIDRNYLINQFRNQSLGTARQLVNASGANPSSAAAGLLALNYGTNHNIGQGLIQADLANRAHEAQVHEFNRATDQYNSEGMFKESVYNRDRFQPLTQPRILGAQMAAQEDATVAAARSANLTSLADALTNIGNENAYLNMVEDDPSLLYQWNYNPYRFGMMTYHPVSKGGPLKTRKKRK